MLNKNVYILSDFAVFLVIYCILSTLGLLNPCVDWSQVAIIL